MYKRNKKIACALLLMMVINNTSSSVLARPLNKEYQSLVMQSVDDVKIVSHSTITIDEAKKWAIKRNATPTFVSLADLFWKYAPSHGDVNPAVAYVQAALETGYGRYGNVLDETYHNTCGLKRTDAGTSTDDSDKEAHKRFDNWDHGVQAHLDHLALYAGAVGYPKTNIEQNYLGDKIDKDSTYDPRHFSYLAGRAHTVKELSNNWAGEGYGDKLIDLYNSLLSESEVENNESDNKPSDGKKQGWYQDSKYNWYYYDSNGKAHKGWLQLPDGKYYMNENGIMVTGWLQKEGNWYYFESSGRAIVNRNEVIDGVEYEFNSEGVSKARAGWQQDNQHNWHYYDDNGLAHIGWLKLPDGKYYMNENGIMVTGWLQKEGNWYYFESSGRAIVNRNEVIDGVEYEFNSEGVSKARAGWQQDNQHNWHYYDDNGLAHIGWLKLPDGKYYMNENGIMVTGWLQEKGSWYYFDKDGRQSYGFIEIEGLRYYLDEEGKAQTGWKNIDGKEYYFYDDCHAAQFEFVDGKYIGHEGYVKNKMTIVIDPGHNQRGDTGASYTHDGVLYDETKMNMDVSVKLRDALVAAGYEVIMTRQPDEYQTSSNVSQSLLNRVVLANNAKADLFISIHHDSFNDTANGMTIFYDTYRPNIETNGVLEDSDGNSYDTTPSRAAIVSKNFTSDLAKNLPSSLGLYNRGARYRNFYVTRNTTMPSMLIECGFISNPNEAKKLADPLHQLKMAGELATNINKLYRK